MKERIFGPLGMNDTGFSVPDDKVSRLSASHEWKSATGAFRVQDGIEDSVYRKRPVFPAAASGLVSTVDDYLAFSRMLLGGGQTDGVRVLTDEAVVEMTSDQLTAEQRAANAVFFGEYSSWGFGMSINLGHGEPWQVPGSFGWVGGRGTSAYSDPKNGIVGILMTNRNMDSPEPPESFTTFWGRLYAPA